ncbi:MAG: transcription termination/antitermination protein NusG [Candidatus Daviesbacteria bacterium]|nr:transcription termination/antitermination protein NusG [Candidatus Daviesbacteria bacterium]
MNDTKPNQPDTEDPKMPASDLTPQITEDTLQSEPDSDQTQTTETPPAESNNSDTPENVELPTNGDSKEPSKEISETVADEETPSTSEAKTAETTSDEHEEPAKEPIEQAAPDIPGARWYVVHTYSGHENRVAQALKQRVESEHLEGRIIDVLVPTQEKIEIKGGKKATVKEKIFPGYILVKMVLDDASWLAVRTTQGVTSFVGMGNKPTPIPASEVAVIVKYMEAGGAPTYKTVYSDGDTVKIVDGPFAEFIGKVDTVDKERGKVRVLVSIFGRETPVELDFLQISKL